MQPQTMDRGRVEIGDFYVNLVKGGPQEKASLETKLTSSTKLLTTTGKPTVMHFYNGG